MGTDLQNFTNETFDEKCERKTVTIQSQEQGKKHRHARRARVFFFCELKGFTDSRIKLMTCKMFY